MSFQFAIDSRSRKAARFMRRVRTELQKALEEEKGKRKITQAELARLLGVDRSVINKQLTGSGNLTLRSIADWAWALDRDIVFSLPPSHSRPGANTFTAEWPGGVPVFMPAAPKAGCGFDVSETATYKGYGG